MVTLLKSKRLVTLLLLCLISFHKPTLFGQCNANVTICNPGTAGPFNFSNPGTPVSSCLDFFGPNTGYIMLYITQSGSLNMLIDGSASSGFLDVAVFNIPLGSNPCTAIQNTSNEIGCNYASSSSGCNQFGTAFPCASSVPAPNVTAGQVLMIVVDNWSGTSNNFTLQLANTPGSAQTGSPNSAINPAGPFCSSSPATQLTAVNNGGTWSGPGTSSSGMFNPATAGVGTHTINYSIGTAPCNASSSTTIQVVSNPSVTVNTATICPGGSASLTATPNVAGGTYLWNPGGFTTQTINVSPGTTTTYTVTYSLGACSSGPKTTTVTVGGAATITVNSATICPGGSATLTANGGSGYTWAPATGLSATTGATVTANPSTTTTYTVTNTGCPGSATSTVTIGPTPTVTVNSPTICTGNNATLTAGGASTYTWSPATGLSTTTGATVTANPTTTTTYTITGTQAGCTGTTTSTVTVDPLPVISVNSEIICAGTTTILNATGANNYSWSPATSLNTSSGATVIASPASTTIYTVTGTTNGCSSTTTSTVTVNAIPIVSVNSATICPGNTATLTASGANSYAWSPATGLSSTSGNIVTANPSNTTTYTVTGTTNGCDATASSTVTVSGIPVINVPPVSVCQGSSVTLSATGATAYTWLPSTGLSATSGSTVTASPTVTTTYTITETSSGCNGSTTTTVTVNSLPAITVGNTGPYCSGSLIQLTSLTNGTSYNWSGPAGFTSTTANPAISNSSGIIAGTYTLTVSDANGCQSTGTTSVVVNNLPTVSVSGNSPICEGSTLNLTASGGTTYNWNGPSFTSGQQNPQITNTTAAMSGTYTVTVTDNNTCTSTGTVNVVISAVPPAPIVQNSTYCLGNTATALNATASAGGTLNWYGTNAGGVPSSVATVPATNTAGTTTYYVSQSISGCTSPAAPINVLVRPLPTCSLNTIIPKCVPLCDQFILTSGSTLTSYSWNMGNSIVNTNNDTISHCYPESGVYTISVTITDNNGCSNTIQFPNAVNVYEIPSAEFTYSPNPVSILEPNVTFYSYSSGNIASYDWSFYHEDSLLNNSSAIEPEFIFPDISTYDVTLNITSVNGCSNSTTKPITVQDDYAYFIPNAFTPDNDEINEEFKVVGTGISKVTMTIFDRWGGIIFKTSELNKGWNGRDKSNHKVDKGVYIYRIEVTDYQGKTRLRHGHVTLVR